jgi:hypothetical protein
MKTPHTLRTRELFIEDLGRVTGAGCGAKAPKITTLALGEEDGGLVEIDQGIIRPPVTVIGEEEDGGELLTTLALGEEDGSAF